MLYASCFIISFSNVVSYNVLVFIIPSSRFLPLCGFDFVPFVSSPVIPIFYTAPIVFKKNQQQKNRYAAICHVPNDGPSVKYEGANLTFRLRIENVMISGSLRIGK